MKVCRHTACPFKGAPQPPDAFYRREKSPDGLDRVCKECSGAVAKAWREANRARLAEVKREDHLRRAYGLTAAEYDALLAAQSGVCKLCRCPERGRHTKGGEGAKRLAVDHCHRTGRVRGLLCHACNVTLGVFERLRDNPDVAAHFAAYAAQVA